MGDRILAESFGAKALGAALIIRVCLLAILVLMCMRYAVCSFVLFAGGGKSANRPSIHLIIFNLSVFFIAGVYRCTHPVYDEYQSTLIVLLYIAFRFMMHLISRFCVTIYITASPSDKRSTYGFCLCFKLVIICFVLYFFPWPVIRIPIIIRKRT